MSWKVVFAGARATFLWLSNLALAVAGVSCLAFGAVTLWRGGDLAAVGTGLTAGLVFLLASSIERFEVLKGLGVEARTRKLDEAITQANATLEQLRELAELSSESVVSLNSKTGRWDSAPTAREAYDTVQRVRLNLKDLGCKDSAIHRVMAPWVLVTTRDQVNALMVELRKPLLLAQDALNLQLQSYPTPIKVGDPEYQALLDERQLYGAFEGLHYGAVFDWPIGSHAEKLRSFVEKMPLSNEADRQGLRNFMAPWLPRIEYLAQNSDLIDKEEWFRAQQQFQSSFQSSLG